MRSFRTVVLRALILAATFALVLPSARALGEEPVKITGLTDVNGNTSPRLGLNDDLVVKLSGKDPIDPAKYALFLDGREIRALMDTRYDSKNHALVFRLRRNSDNADAWTGLLGSPTAMTRQVSVTLGEVKPSPATAQPTISADGGDPHFQLVVISGWWLVVGTVVVLVTFILVWGGARQSTILKDSLLPQLAPRDQPYSLGRWQMAFWFTLIFASFIFLLALLWDYNTVTPQALILMGISGATALFAVAIDVTKDTPVDAANNKLRALGLNTHDDVIRIRQEKADREAKKKAIGAGDPTISQLEKEIADKQQLLDTFEGAVAPYKSRGWYHDLTTDINGPALHRLQVFCWTWVLGGVFIIGVYRNLAMPQFSDTLLALMGVSSAGYVGFKYPEKQN